MAQRELAGGVIGSTACPVWAESNPRPTLLRFSGNLTRPKSEIRPQERQHRSSQLATPSVVPEVCNSTSLLWSCLVAKPSLIGGASLTVFKDELADPCAWKYRQRSWCEVCDLKHLMAVYSRVHEWR